jgi:Rubisco LSMT substrate-binding
LKSLLEHLTLTMPFYSRLQGIPMGSQLYISYGRKSNHQYMLNYGFAIEDNFDPDGESPNEVNLELELNKADALYANKLRFWCAASDEYDDVDKSDDDEVNKHRDHKDVDEQVNTSFTGPVGLGDYELNHIYEFDDHELQEENDNQNGHAEEDDKEAHIKVIKVCTQDEKTMQELFSLLRFLVCDESELAEIVSRADTDDLEDPMICYEIHSPINIRNELSAMKLLHNIVMHRLDQYPTSFGKNVEDLKDKSALAFFDIQRNAKIQITGEQEVLHFLAYWATTAVQAIASSGRMKADTLLQDREELHQSRGKTGFVRYCSDVLGSLVSRNSGLDQESLCYGIDDRSMWTVSVQ